MDRKSAAIRMGKQTRHWGGNIPGNTEAWAIDVLIALSLFLPTLFFVPHWVFLFAILLLLVWGAHSSSIALPLTFLCAIAIRAASPRALWYVIFFICGEVIVGVYEYALGQPTIFPGQAEFVSSQFVDSAEYYYEDRVFGLSSNSSDLAQKVFLSTLLAFFLDGSSRRKTVVLAILFVGLSVTFNRTAIVSTLVFLGLLMAHWSWLRMTRIVAVGLVFIVALAAIIVFFQPLLLQFTRGQLSLLETVWTRVYLLTSAMEHILNNIWIGNGSLTYRIQEPWSGSWQHAHNSVLMLIATHGILLGCMLLLYCALGLSRRNLPYVGAMFVFSMAQYMFFWNVSLADFVLFYLLAEQQRRRANFLPAMDAILNQPQAQLVLRGGRPLADA
jgi:hypothetical protein